MSTDDVPDPLAGVDLRAWQPPPPPAGQIDAILSQVTEHTRVDGAPAMELPSETSRRTRRQRTRWVAIGAVLGAAAAVLVMALAWPRDRAPSESRQADPKQVVVTNPPVSPGGTVAPSIADCRALRDGEDWTAALTCANQRMQAAPSDPDAAALADQAKRETAAKLAFDDLATAVETKDAAAARQALGRIPPDSVYFERAKELFGTLPEPEDEPHQDRPVKTTDGDDLAPCDDDAYLAEARDAGASNQWGKMLKKALAAEECSPSRDARQLALLAACRVGNSKIAKRYVDELKDHVALRQTCVGVVELPAETREVGGCTQSELDALIGEAREAGKSNQWSKMLARAEAANRCIPSKPARQLALIAACRLGNTTKARRYWKEFSSNNQMIQACIGVVK